MSSVSVRRTIAPELQHPRRGRQADASAPRFAQHPHERRVRQRLGRGHVDGPATSSCAISQRMARVKSSWCTHETYCRPSPAVPPRPRRTSASSVSNTPPRSGLIVIAERSAILRVRGVGRRVERALPRRRHLDAEPPRVRRARLHAADRAVLVVRRPERVGVDRRRAGLDPQGRRPRRLRDGLADDPRRVDPRVEHRGAVGRGVAAVHAAAGQVDDDVGAVELGRPRSQRLAVPGDDASGGTAPAGAPARRHRGHRPEMPARAVARPVPIRPAARNACPMLCRIPGACHEIPGACAACGPA